MTDFSKFIQVAGIIDLAEAEMLINCGVNFLGFPLRLPVNKVDCTEEEAASIIAKTKDSVKSVAITYLNNADEIIKFCRELDVEIIQLHGDISIDELRKLKTVAPELSIIKSLVMKQGNFNNLETIVTSTQNYVDAFITDTYDPVTGASGATGKTHDWKLSRRLVELSSKPVILAGGINHLNVYEAMMTVKPAGVDTHTGVEGIDGRKDYDKVKKFVEEAKRAFETLNSI
ncbi:MAG: phosphoribosylanthranilate isomerase [Ignavibacteriaceae bacterium]|jgi:phosphoribosylanthranilate isomerase|nr:phosphoribosylanthranilate isomerase [Ignavibacteriaceae bacterium]